MEDLAKYPFAIIQSCVDYTVHDRVHIGKSKRNHTGENLQFRLKNSSTPDDFEKVPCFIESDRTP